MLQRDSYSGLTSVSISNSVITIGAAAFGSCRNLKNVTVKWTTPLNLDPNNSPFNYDNNLSNRTLYVPVGTKSLYQVAPVWQDFRTIVEVGFTGIKTINTPFNVYLSNENLHVNSPVSEKIRIYSITGMLLYQIDKQAGEANFNIGHIRDKILIVKGDSGWVKKVVVK
jgi:hypothetical protein